MQFLEQGGADVENEYVDLAYLPFFDAKERKANTMLANFVKYTGKDKANGYGVYAWVAGIALRDAVDERVIRRGARDQRGDTPRAARRAEQHP